jgi:U-box domain/C2 domain
MDANGTATSTSATTSLVHNQAEIEEADIEDLNLFVEDIDEEAFIATVQNAANPSPSSVAITEQSEIFKTADRDDLDKKGSIKVERGTYILGTLVIRVVAARDLDAVDRGGIGNLFFGGKDRARSSKGGGTANPYATVRFGSTTQRTSEAYETTDPIWPRGEIMYMDVTHHSWETDFVDYVKSKAYNNGSNENLSINANRIGHSSLLKQESEVSLESFQSPAKPVLTVAIFHAIRGNRLNKYPNKKGYASGDSDDTFLGMTSIDLTQLLTGKVRSLDEWLPLQGSMSSKASVRVVCEYDASDAPPLPGDVVKFTDFCHPAHLYPAVQFGRVYTVHEVDGDEVLISWTSPEGWVSSFLVHRFMLICIERHQTVVGICQDELASIKERIAYSPMIHAVQETVDRVPDEGLLDIGAETLQNGVSLLSRWWENGFETTAQDLTFATNWDGRHNPSAESLAVSSNDSNDESTATTTANISTTSLPISISNVESDADRLELEPPLPNMPACPITGEPMRDPVVAADGHTYERSAISRWLLESNKSPLTGAILPHKNLVPNYMLLSSLQEAAAALATSQGTVKATPTDLNSEMRSPEIDVEDSEITDEVNINE